MFFYLVVTIGQLYSRLIQPYLVMPFSLATLVDKSRSEPERVQIADQLLAKPRCCVESNFAQPVLDEVRQCGGSRVFLANSALYQDLESSLRMKVSNLEIELNFARASSMRTAMRGRAHSICSLTAKHVGAEMKLSHRRQLFKRKLHHVSKKPCSRYSTEIIPSLIWLNGVCMFEVNHESISRVEVRFQMFQGAQEL